MKDSIKAVLIGFGAVGSGIVQESMEKGVDYIGVFDVLDSLIGKDAGDIFGTGKTGIVIRDVKELPEFFKNNHVDIMIDTATAPMSVSLDEIRLALSSGINVLTSLADNYVMKTHDPELFQELDGLARENGVTFFASGIQDIFWTSLPLALTGSNLEINEIRGRNVALIDEFGAGVADECYVGWDLEDFNKANESGELPENDFLLALYEIVAKLGLHATDEHSEVKPLLSHTDRYLDSIDRTVKRGQLIGNYVESTIHTEEGIDLVSEFVSKFSEEGDTDLNKWEIRGAPDINVVTDHMQGEITTGSTIINRIPDVINAPAGVISAGEIETPYFKVRDLNTYVK